MKTFIQYLDKNDDKPSYRYRLESSRDIHDAENLGKLSHAFGMFGFHDARNMGHTLPDVSSMQVGVDDTNDIVNVVEFSLDHELSIKDVKDTVEAYLRLYDVMVYKVDNKVSKPRATNIDLTNEEWEGATDTLQGTKLNNQKTWEVMVTDNKDGSRYNVTINAGEKTIARTLTLMYLRGEADTDFNNLVVDSINLKE